MKESQRLLRSGSAILIILSALLLTFSLHAAVPPPSATPAQVIVSGKTSTAVHVKIVAVGQQIPKTYAGKKMKNTPGYSWYVSQHYALKTSKDAAFARHVLEISELAYPHHVHTVGREPDGIETTRMAIVYGRDKADMQRAVKTDLNTFWAGNAGGVTLPGNKTAYNFPSGGLEYHRRDLVIHENLHVLEMCVAGHAKTPVRYGEGCAHASGNHVWDPKKKRLTVAVVDKATVNNPYDEGLHKLRQNWWPANTFYGDSGPDYDPAVWTVWTQFLWTDPERAMKQRIWRDETFRSHRCGDQLLRYDRQLMTSVFGAASDLDRTWRKWVAARRNTFHYVEWGWEQEGSTLISYGYPKRTKFSQTNVNLPPGESSPTDPLILDYPDAVPEPHHLVGKTQRGNATPSVGALLDYSRDGHGGRAGLSFGVGGRELRASQQQLVVVVHARGNFKKSALVVEGQPLGIPNQELDLPQKLIAAATADNYRYGLNVTINHDHLRITVRGGTSADQQEISTDVPISKQQRQRLLSKPMAILSKDGRHEITPYLGIAKRPEIDYRKPAPANRWRFPAEDDLYGLYRAAWILGGKTPKSLLALKASMTTSVPQSQQNHATACNQYKSQIVSIAKELYGLENVPRNKEALAAMLGIDSITQPAANAKTERPSFRTAIQGSRHGTIRGEIKVNASGAGISHEAKQSFTVEKAKRELFNWTLPSFPAAAGPIRVTTSGTATFGRWQIPIESTSYTRPGVPLWWVMGPFDNRGDATTNTRHPVETSPRTLATTHKGKNGKTLSWQQVVRSASLPAADPNVVKIADLCGWHKNAAAYCLTWVESDRDQRVTLSVGSDDGCMIWLNGKEIHRNLTNRGYQPDHDQLQIQFNKGINELLVKVTQSSHGWSFGARILDEQGLPAQGIRYRRK